jgi:hypothetical protein
VRFTSVTKMVGLKHGLLSVADTVMGGDLLATTRDSSMVKGRAGMPQIMGGTESMLPSGSVQLNFCGLQLSTPESFELHVKGQHCTR